MCLVRLKLGMTTFLASIRELTGPEILICGDEEKMMTDLVLEAFCLIASFQSWYVTKQSQERDGYTEK